MFLIIGKKHSPFIQYFQKQEIPYFVILDEKDNTKPIPNSITTDLTNPQKVFAIIDQLPQKPQIAFSIYEQYLPITAEINQYLQIAHALPPQIANLATDKVLMRQSFSQSKFPISPNFANLNSLSDALNFTAKYGYPVIIKPNNLSKSLLVIKCNNENELHTAVELVQNQAPKLYQKYTLQRPIGFIIEEFMEGSIHTVMGFADQNGKIVTVTEIVDNISARDVGHNDNYIFSRTLPSKLSEDHQKAIIECAKEGMKAMKLKSCPAHIEIILTKNGPKIIEIGARIGGYRSRMYKLANNINVIKAVTESISGKLPNIKTEKQEFCRVIELFPEKTANFQEITNLETLKTLKSLNYISIKKQPGDPIGRATDGFKAAAIIILHHQEEKQIAEDYQYILDNVKVITT